MTHADLVKRAARWLCGSQRCVVVMTEAACQCNSEFPDAIGWTARGSSILVECKTSLNDWYADQYKPSRRGGPAMGRYRYYLMAPELTKRVATRAGPWGVLAAHAKTIRVVQKAVYQDCSSGPELALLVSRMSRMRGDLDRLVSQQEGRETRIEHPKSLEAQASCPHGVHSRMTLWDGSQICGQCGKVLFVHGYH